MSKNDLADKLAKGVRRAHHPSTSEPAAPAEQPPATSRVAAASPDVAAPQRTGTPSALHPARIWPD